MVVQVDVEDQFTAYSRKLDFVQLYTVVSRQPQYKMVVHVASGKEGSSMVPSKLTECVLALALLTHEANARSTISDTLAFS